MILANNLSVVQSSSGGLTLSGVISETPAASMKTITIGGTNTTVITGPNSYSGGTTISSGILNISSDPAGMAPLGLVAGAVTINTGTFQAGAPFSTQMTRGFTLTGAAIFDANTFGLTIAGIIGGPGSLTLGGTAGTLTLSGANTYSGGTIINVGTLSVTSDGNLGSAAGPLAINSATFQASGTFNSARAVTLTGGATIDTNGFNLGLSGNITGSGSLTKISAGTLVLSGNNQYGPTTVSAGTLQGNTNSLTGNITNNSILVFNQTFSGTYAGVLDGVGPTLTINGGGSLTMTANSSGYTGMTTLTPSTQLIMNGNLGGSPLTINAGGVLRGTGTVGPTTHFGQIFPGNSIGTITVNNMLTFMAGSSLFLEIVPLGNSMVNVIGAPGTASLTLGNLIVSPGSGFFGLTKTYTLLTTAGPLATVFISPFTMTNPNFVGTLTYIPGPPGSVELFVRILRPFLDFPFANSNERAVGINIDDLNMIGALSPDFATVIDSLAGQSDAVINDALDQMHPAAMSALAELQTEIGGQMLSLFHRKPTLICGCSAPGRIWVEPFGNWLHEKQQGQEIGFHATSRGVAFGLDAQFLGAWTLGIGGAWNATDLSWSLNRGHAYTNGLFGSFYTDLALGNFYFGGSAYYGKDWYDTARGIHFVTVDRQADAHYHGRDIGGQFTAAYYFGTPACLFYPYGTVDYLRLDNESYSESGANSLDLNVEGYRSTTLRSEAGIALQVIDKNYAETICISPLVSMGWVAEWPLQRDDYTAAFVNGPIPFTVKGWDQTWQLLNLRFGLGLTYRCLTLDTQYILDISPDGDSPLLNQRANFRFNFNF
jgi:autotransporter-associated beta strand protein